MVQIWETPSANPAEWVETRGAEREQGWLKLGSPLVGKVEHGVAAAAGFSRLWGILCPFCGERVGSRWDLDMITLKRALYSPNWDNNTCSRMLRNCSCACTNSIITASIFCKSGSVSSPL